MFRKKVEKNKDVIPYSEPILLSDLYKKKNMNYSVMQQDIIHLEDDIALHAAWLFRHIYSIPFNPPSKSNNFIGRNCYNIQHAARMALYIPIFANLYRRYKNTEALHLSAEDIKLLQITALFDAAAKENESQHDVDHESAIMLYVYLTNQLGVNKCQAKKFAEFIMNKEFSYTHNQVGDLSLNEDFSCYNEIFSRRGYEPHVTGCAIKYAMFSDKNLVSPFQTRFDKKICYYELIDDSDIFTWKPTLAWRKPIGLSLLHDAASIESIKSKERYDADCLDFYQLVACDQPQAFDELALFITEVRSLLDIQGETPRYINKKIKKSYESESAYTKIESAIYQSHYKLLPTLYAKGKLITKEDLQQPIIESHLLQRPEKITDETIQAALNAQLIYTRSIQWPLAAKKKTPKTDKPQSEKIKSFSFIEIKKMLRQSKSRSISLVGWGGLPYASEGFLIFDPDVDDMSLISSIDADTGRFKMKQSYRKPSNNELKKGLEELKKKQKRGGDAYIHDCRPMFHNEILYDIKYFNAIYFSLDKTITCSSLYPYSSILIALYLQDEYFHMTGVKLPIFEYSGIHNYIKPTPRPSLESIIIMWTEMCKQYITRELDTTYGKGVHAIYKMSVEEIKTNIMYRPIDRCFKERVSGSIPVDFYYDEEAKNQINNAILLARLDAIASYPKYVKKTVKHEQTNIFEHRTFKHFVTFPALRHILGNHAVNKLKLFIAELNDMEKVAYVVKNIAKKIDSCFLDGMDHQHFKKLKKIIYFNSEMMFFKAYLLAILLKDEPSRNKIQALANHYLLELLNQIQNFKNNSFLSYIPDDKSIIQHFLIIAQLFDLYDSVKEDFEISIIQSLSNLKPDDLLFLVSKIKNAGCLSETLIQHIQLALEPSQLFNAKQAISNIMTDSDTENTFKSYFEAIKRGVVKERNCDFLIPHIDETHRDTAQQNAYSI